MTKKPQINILCFFFFPSVGGAQVCAHSMAMTYVDLGYSVNLITSKISYQFLKDKKLPYNIISIGKISLSLIKKFSLFEYFFSYYLYIKLKKIIKNESINIIFGLWPFGAINSKLASKKIKFIIRPTGDDIQTDLSVGYGLARDKQLSSLLRKIINKNKNFLAISETVKKDIPRDKNVILSSPGIHLSYFEKNANYDFIKKYQKKERTIISIGRNHPKKCFEHLIYLAEILPNNFRFLIIGKETDKLKKKIINLNDIKRFKFVDELVPSLSENDNYFPSKSLIKYLSLSHYFVYPSKTETYANVALEAMASYVPCILSNVPGNNDTIFNNNGLLFNFGNIKQMKEKILFLEENPDERKKIILNGKKFSEKNDWKIKCNEIVKLSNDTILS